jgi:hypothetical protein
MLARYPVECVKVTWRTFSESTAVLLIWLSSETTRLWNSPGPAMPRMPSANSTATDSRAPA